jgi:lambda repressor-like predicted transcriptional regulator
MPVACYSYKGTLKYLTGKRIAHLFREAVKAIHPKTSTSKLQRYSAHSLQVWACVLLDEAGMSPEFIMARLRWMGNSFRMYLRDTGIIQDKHRNVLRAVSQEIIDLIAGSSVNIPHMAGLSTVGVDNAMGDYAEED